MWACSSPEGYVSYNDDCDDTDPNIYPGAPAIADGKDNDCDGIIDRVSQTIDFISISDQPADIGFATLNATSSSGLPVTFVLEQGNAELQDDTLYIHGAGMVSITAYQDCNVGYLAAEPVNQTFCINPIKPEISAAYEEGQPILISSSEADNRWFINGILLAYAVNDTLLVEESGTYSVQVETDQCTSETSDDFNIEATGLTSNILGEVIAYPNPSEGKITFSIPEQMQGSKLRFSLLDLSGRYILSAVSFPQSMARASLDLSHLEAGAYTCLLLNNNGELLFRGQIILK